MNEAIIEIVTEESNPDHDYDYDGSGSKFVEVTRRYKIVLVDGINLMEDLLAECGCCVVSVEEVTEVETN